MIFFSEKILDIVSVIKDIEVWLKCIHKEYKGRSVHHQSDGQCREVPR